MLIMWFARLLQADTAYRHRGSSDILPKSLALKQGNLNATLEVHFSLLIERIAEAGTM
jgi:hypothetical protein